MRLSSTSFGDGLAIPSEFAFAVIEPHSHVALSSNRNPQLAWTEVPEGTRSFVVTCHDIDVPSRGDDVNQEGREIPHDLPRVDFFHWSLLDIPASVRDIAAGSQSDGVTARGKPGPRTPGGWRHGINDFTQWFAGDDEMRGTYYGYDGPAPPWNDSRLHHYIFTVYAIDVERLDVAGDLTGATIRQALRGHVLAEAGLTATYSLNPRIAR